MRRLLIVGLIVCAAAPGLLAVAGSGSPGDGSAEGGVSPAVEELLTYGAETYHWNCSVCHGVNGGGIEEARLSFPEDHRNCARCHRPSNRIVQPLDRPIVDNDMFSIGDPPALHPTARRSSTLAGTASPDVLFEYLRTTMPRYDPGRLSDAEYRALTAFLLDMNGRRAEVASLVGR